MFVTTARVYTDDQARSRGDACVAPTHQFARRNGRSPEHSSDAHHSPDAKVVSIGPALIFERLWRETGCQEVVRKLLATRHHHFDVERAVFMTVLHRLMVSGSDRSALQWRRDQAIDGAEALELQHLYRAMGWLGEALGEREPDAPSPRRTKDLIEEELFARRRDLFSAFDLVFFDTTSVFFTGNGGDTLGQYGKSKDHRSDCKQMVLGMVIDGDGLPVCSEMWPGNTTDVTTLDQVAQRLQSRFAVRRVCLVADAGMISKKMIAAVEARGWFYILGARLRRTKEVRDVVLSDTGAFETVEVARQRPDPMELQVKEVTVSDTPCKGAVKAPHKPRRYVVCRNRDQARKDAATRAQILAGLENKLRSSGPKSVVANKGDKRYLKAEKGAFAVDLDKARDEQRFDGMWVLRTNTELSAVEIALRYKQFRFGFPTVEDEFEALRHSCRRCFHRSPARGGRNARSCRPAHKPHKVSETVTVYYRFSSSRWNPGNDAGKPVASRRTDCRCRRFAWAAVSPSVVAGGAAEAAQ